MRPAPARLPIRAMVALLLALGGCGKLGSPDTPAGAIYPKIYPAGATVAAPSSAPSGPPATTGPAFTADGAWIDPTVRLPQIDPYADTAASSLYTGTGIGAGMGATGPTATAPRAP